MKKIFFSALVCSVLFLMNNASADTFTDEEMKKLGHATGVCTEKNIMDAVKKLYGKEYAKSVEKSFLGYFGEYISPDHPFGKAYEKSDKKRSKMSKLEAKIKCGEFQGFLAGYATRMKIEEEEN